MVLAGNSLYSQDTKNSIIFNENSIIFGMSESEFTNSYPGFIKSDNIYEYSDINHSINSNIRYEVKFTNDNLSEFAVYMHWPTDAQLTIIDNIKKQLKVTKIENDEDFNTTYFAKDNLKGYVLLGENATLDIWDSRFVKK